MIALAVIIVAVSFVWLKAFWSSRASFNAGQKYLQSGKHVKAITFFDRSLHWYAPLNPYPFKSAARLWHIGLIAQKSGDIKTALMAVRTIRRGMYAARSFYTPGKDWIARCDSKIASLMAKKPSGPDKDTTTPPADKKSAEPRVFWTLVLQVGFFGWILSVCGFLTQALRDPSAARLKSKPAIAWGILFVFFYFLWVIGMVKA